MERKIHTIAYDREFRDCPLCGYRDGFHSMLKQQHGSLCMLFICPSCHSIFDIGLRLPDESISHNSPSQEHKP